MRRNNTLRNTLPGLGLVVASMLPAVLSSAPSVGPSGGAPPKPPVATVQKGAKEFSVSVGNLREWATAVEVTLDGVRVEGRSNVHALDSDCEIHFGAHASSFQGEPDGLVLEPMNACVQPFPGQSEQKNADWTKFGDQIKGVSVTASGVPRIWPEHLSGGGASNPDHAVELHPLTSVVSGGQTFDFAPNVFAGDFRGGVGEPTALNILRRTTVSVTKNGDSVDISFKAGTIGNFTVLDIVIDRDSIASDGAGSFRMDGEVAVDDSTTVPVRIVTVKGSPINVEIQKIKSRRRRAQINMTALVLFSLSPESLLEAANKSNGNDVAVERPIQLILYGPPNGD
jgi:hypothetical protein